MSARSKIIQNEDLDGTAGNVARSFASVSVSQIAELESKATKPNSGCAPTLTRGPPGPFTWSDLAISFPVLSAGGRTYMRTIPSLTGIRGLAGFFVLLF